MSEPLEFMVKALRAAPAQRETLWLKNRGDTSTDAARLRVAVLESLPSHSGYDPVAAVRDLRKLSHDETDPDIRNLARLRLIELESMRDCRAKTDDLQERLDQIVDIERKLDKDNGGKPANTGR